MNFSELADEIYTITNRPDREAETKSAIKSATLKAHRLSYFSKDIYETGIEFPESDFRQSFDYISFISNFRAFKYVRLADSETDDSGRFIDIITPEEILDAYGRNRNDIAYVAGRVLEIRAATSFKYALLGCYVLPIVREEAYVSWVAELHPYAIIHEAAGKVFVSLGQMEEANAQKELAAAEYQELLISATTDVGY